MASFFSDFLLFAFLLCFCFPLCFVCFLSACLHWRPPLADLPPRSRLLLPPRDTLLDCCLRPPAARPPLGGVLSLADSRESEESLN
uniref:Putative secreted protein n=1 Tax=Panstrongylus lignarius TaxID=156445 RepID=A0A224Y3X1_9HEMI